jgi:hypothetical protein
VVCDLSQFKPKVRKGGIHCKILHPSEKHEGVNPKGSKFCFATNQQNPKKGVSKNGLIQIFVSHFYAWLPYVRI